MWTLVTIAEVVIALALVVLVLALLDFCLRPLAYDVGRDTLTAGEDNLVRTRARDRHDRKPAAVFRDRRTRPAVHRVGP